MALRLNLGCADNLFPASEGWLNVDICPPDIIPDGYAFELVDLADDRQPWPWGESTVDEIRAFDVLEHLPDKLRSWNESWHILKPDGILDLFVPTTDGRGWAQDPTHRSAWTPNDLWYVSEDFREWQRFRKSYGITANFRVIEQSHMLYGDPEDKVWKWKARLEALK